MVRWRVARALILLMVCSLPAALFAGDAEQKILTQEDVDRVLEVFPGYVQWIKESAPGLKLRGAQQNPSSWVIAGMFKNGASD
jgi:hypothetical protein